MIREKTLAKPNTKQPVKTVDIYCVKCKFKLMKYRKGGKGSLVKCFHERIVDRYFDIQGHCPNCGSKFARDTIIRGVPAYKIIGGKVVVK